jgi:hypothetical protein
MHVIALLQLVSGFAVGMLVGMTGVGGGSRMRRRSVVSTNPRRRHDPRHPEGVLAVGMERL